MPIRAFAIFALMIAVLLMAASAAYAFDRAHSGDTADQRNQSGAPTPTPQALVVGEGAAAHGAPAWNAAGFRGQSIKVGIIDFGGSGFSNYAELMGSELPPTVKARCYIDGDEGAYTSELADCATGSGTHGTRMTEAIADIAPEIVPYVARPYLPSELLDTVRWMVAEDVDVIVYPISWIWDGPGDGSSPADTSPLKAVDLAVASGALWVNSVGNWAQDTWFGAFADADADGRHEFAPGAECNALLKTEPGRTIIAQLRWNDAWGGASRDLDLHIYETRDGELTERAVADAEQSGAPEHNPYEILRYTPEDDAELCLAVHQKSGDAPEWLQLMTLRHEQPRHYTLSGSIRAPGESANPGMLTVGAALWQTPNEIDPTSGRGPTPDGRVKPDLVGVHGANSATAGPWFGTGQAAAHVAGIAALVRQRFPDYTPRQVAEYLKAHAQPRGDAVPNNTWGYGLAQLPPIDAAQSAPIDDASAHPPSTGDVSVPALALMATAAGIALIASGVALAARASRRRAG